MNSKNAMCPLAALLVAGITLMSACGGGGDGGGSAGGSVGPSAGAPVRVNVTGPNAVTYWNEVATNTINVPATATGSPAEKRPTDSVDLAVVHLAIYNALAAITGRYQLYGGPIQAAAGGDISQEAAVGAAAYGVLKGLFPNRAAQYQPAYDSFVAAINDNAAKSDGLALGDGMAQAMLALRGDDGRSVTLAPYVPGTAPGAFRGVNPINRYLSSIKPFAIASASQFRAPAPPALDSDVYANDVNETRMLGGVLGSTRTDAQLEIARFHTEPPFRFWPRNLRRFAMTDGTLIDQARLLAMLFVVQADAAIACFESKYHYESWRPQSAIPLADTDNNPATTADASWTPVVPTPNHPEYPAAHACVSAALMEALKTYYGTDRVEFTLDSTVTGTTRSFTATQAHVEEVRGARIYGGMHFRNSLVRGEELGTSVAKWVLQHNFLAR
ncbi:vanadium-dependent haloperoxidase [Variovorax paradoxus]|nr:vanadium-dependent haloperoxidase [Variovorax paradoxus]MBT2305431.1 vanadium-dependent haloperoxidase [Variovorax paradoxus]